MAEPHWNASVLLHEMRPEPGGRGRGSMLFQDLAEVVTCETGDGVAAAFRRIETLVDSGLSVAGGFAYELGYHLEPRLRGCAPEGPGPLFQVGAFRHVRSLSSEQAADHVRRRSESGASDVGGLRVPQSRAGHVAKARRVLDYIGAGDVYQVNLTTPATFAWSGDVWSLYAAMAAHQSAPFAAVLDLPGLKAASASPELFFRKRGGRIESRPMKGTARRGRDAAEDAEIARALAADPKNRAENLMIVDLIRNDLGRVAEVGSVAVEDLFHVETYETVLQMVSHVSARIDPGTSLETLFRSLFPCGSVTGAPKIRAMEIIAELEARPRGLYTGAIGYMTPAREAAFSVPIRTAEHVDGETWRFGIGSGVVWDSCPEGEYDECLLKARFLERALGGAAR